MQPPSGLAMHGILVLSESASAHCRSTSVESTSSTDSYTAASIRIGFVEGVEKADKGPPTLVKDAADGCLVC